MPKGRAQGTPKVLGIRWSLSGLPGVFVAQGIPQMIRRQGGRYESSGRSAREDDDENDDLGRWWSRCIGDERQENNT